MLCRRFLWKNTQFVLNNRFVLKNTHNTHLQDRINSTKITIPTRNTTSTVTTINQTNKDGITVFPQRLLNGYNDFLAGRYAIEQNRYKILAKQGQKPRVLLIGCCDSRVAPEMIFNTDPGEIFVVRNVANLSPPYAPNDDLHGTSAALEFAVMGLRVEHIVVMGHAGCGGVRAFLENECNPYTRPLSSSDFIGKWVKLLAPAYEKCGHLPHGDVSTVTDDYVNKLALESIRQSLQNLRTFPCVQTLESRGKLQLHGAYFGVMDGVLKVLNPKTNVFERVSNDPLEMKSSSAQDYNV